MGRKLGSEKVENLVILCQVIDFKKQGSVHK